MDYTDVANLIANTSLFANLDEAGQHELARYSGEISATEGDTLFADGDPADRFFVIISGEVLIQRREDESRSRDVAQFIAGESFGEIDVLRSGQRSVTAVATVPCRILAIPAPPTTFSSMLQQDPVRFAGILHTLLAYVAGRIRSTNQLLTENNSWITEIRRQVYTDKLTGLYNNTFMTDAFNTFPGDAVNTDSRVNTTRAGGSRNAADARVGRADALLVFKPDRFKEINDTYGHEVGDRAIQRLSRMFYATVSPIGWAVRYRGNEFVALLPAYGLRSSQTLAESLLVGVREIDLSDATGGAVVALTASIGIATVDEAPDEAAAPAAGFTPASASAPAPDGPTLLKRAFDRMMVARTASGDRVYTSEQTAP